MDIKAARKTVQAEKPKGNFLVVRLSYDSHLVLPYQEGIALMASIANAENMEDEYTASKRRIVPLVRDKITASPLSRKEYEDMKIAALLGISVADLERAEEEELNKDQEPRP